MVRTRPWAARLAAADHERRRRSDAAAVAAIVLELGEAPYAGVPCWTGRLDRWATWTVPLAYDCRYETEVRPVMPGNPISRTALLAVAEARARYADHATGRNSRPTNERLAADTGYSVRTVQRADTALRLLGVATEVLRGRQRTRIERLASWRVGDRGRGWASVWALHDHPQLNRLIRRLSPHPRSGPVRNKNSPIEVITTDPGSPAGRLQGARRAAEHQTPEARPWRGPGAPIRTARRGAPTQRRCLGGTPGRTSRTRLDTTGFEHPDHRLGGVHGRSVPDSPYNRSDCLVRSWPGTAASAWPSARRPR
ncbi:helix-turn-helix domain-containing protein [Mycobacterium intracellulare]|uniref:helix-turn-helix domain-containing protein n=1 Tax=Mycobacterium intracellulare TaxID=1767 RepID=UPI000A4DEB97|nr:helix-turn-helix domain-containing protein [Mycobacterium intracellulare]